MTDAIPDDVIKAMSAARGCVEPDRCNGRLPTGSCAECLSATRDAIAAAEAMGWKICRGSRPR